MMDDTQLLERFATRGDEDAFRALIDRHVDLVYSAALRLANGDAPLAEDVAQSVFTDLARKARALPSDTVLTGWLYEAARFAAAKAIRGERRRQAREQEALTMQDTASDTAPDWEQLRPVLDDAMGELSAPDRNAILLRYFQNQDFHAVGLALGVSDDAAQKRVSRAVDRLREFLGKRGVTLGAHGLVVVISANAIQAAPVGLSAAIAGIAVTTAGTATILTMNWLNGKIAAAIVAAALVAGTSVHFLQQRRFAEAATINRALVTARDQLLAARDAALATTQAQQQELEQLRRDANDLPRLRGEVMRLRAAAQEAAQMQRGLPPAGALPLVAGLVINHVGATDGVKLDEELVRTNILVKVGSPYSRADIDRDVRGLYETGLFSNVRVSEEKTNSDFMLTYLVQDRPQALYATIGATTPEAGLRRLVAASKLGDTNGVTAFVGWQRGDGVSDGVVEQMHGAMPRNIIGTLTNTAGIRILNQQAESTDVVRARVEVVEQNGKVRLVELRLLRESDEWKPAISIYRSQSGSFGARFALPLTPELGPTNQ